MIEGGFTWPRGHLAFGVAGYIQPQGRGISQRTLMVLQLVLV